MPSTVLTLEGQDFEETTYTPHAGGFWVTVLDNPINKIEYSCSVVGDVVTVSVHDGPVPDGKPLPPGYAYTAFRRNGRNFLVEPLRVGAKKGWVRDRELAKDLANPNTPQDTPTGIRLMAAVADRALSNAGIRAPQP